MYKALGLDAGFVLDDAAARKSWASSAPSYVQPNVESGRGPASSWDFPGWGLPITTSGGRRPSVMTITTISGEDAFIRATKMNDPAYGLRKDAWSFRCENTHPMPQAASTSVSAPAPQVTQRSASGTRGTRIGVQEIWKQDYVGRFKTDRMIMQRQ